MNIYCQCFKSNNIQCHRPPSQKSGDNPSFCWQHQKCHKSLTTDNGIISVVSTHSVDETIENLKKILQNKKIPIFAIIDHSGEAKKVGIEMPPTKLLIFGNPIAGTPLMLAAPSIAIDLPLKILIRRDDNGKVWVSYNSPEYLQKRHGVSHKLMGNIAVVQNLVAKAI